MEGERMKNYVIFIVQGYERYGQTGELQDVCTIEVFADTEKEALKKAKSYVKKPFYRVSSVIEKRITEK